MKIVKVIFFSVRYYVPTSPLDLKRLILLLAQIHVIPPPFNTPLDPLTLRVLRTTSVARSGGERNADPC